jgi:hypothetical protein
LSGKISSCGQSCSIGLAGQSNGSYTLLVAAVDRQGKERCAKLVVKIPEKEYLKIFKEWPAILKKEVSETPSEEVSAFDALHDLLKLKNDLGGIAFYHLYLGVTAQLCDVMGEPLPDALSIANTHYRKARRIDPHICAEVKEVHGERFEEQCNDSGPIPKGVTHAACQQP